MYHILAIIRRAIRQIVNKNRVLDRAHKKFYSVQHYMYRRYRRNIKKSIDYWGANILPANKGNDLIAQRLESCEPTAIGKLGSVEAKALHSFFVFKGKVAAWDDDTKMTLYRNAGVFPLDNDVFYHWSLEFMDSIKSLDLIGVWYNTYESKLIKMLVPSVTLTKVKSLYPYYYQDPWSRCLEDKRVLLIHPFEQSIRRQFIFNREKLWKNAKVLPQFQLETIKVPLSDALTKSEFKDWFQTLEHLKKQISEKQFDIALIGAGAYSLPLAAYIKKKGKCAVHMGGSAQILFGIKGGRWDDSGMYNEFWTRPSKEETPENASIIERGCYW